MSYKSPIDVIRGAIETQFENNVYKAVQQYGISVDKDELIKALKYDRGQYEAGYMDGRLSAINSKWISVADRLPAESGKYIVCTINGNIYQTKFYTYPESAGGHWGQKDKGKNITHWQPLPEPPRECTDCRYFVGCECFDGKPCGSFQTERKEKK